MFGEIRSYKKKFIHILTQVETYDKYNRKFVWAGPLACRLLSISYGIVVVSIGAILAFKVIFTPLEYVPTMSKRLHFFGSKYTINVYNMDF